MEETKEILGIIYKVVTPKKGEDVIMPGENVYFNNSVEVGNLICHHLYAEKNCTVLGDQHVGGDQDVLSSQNVRGNQYVLGDQDVRGNQDVGGYQHVGGDQHVRGYQHVGGDQDVLGDQNVRGDQDVKTSNFTKKAVAIYCKWTVWINYECNKIGFGCHDMRPIAEWDALLERRTVAELVKQMGEEATERECIELLAAYNYAKARIPAIQLMKPKADA